MSGTKALQYVALPVYIFFLGFPLLWLLSASFKSSQELNSLLGEPDPAGVGLDNYATPSHGRTCSVRGQLR